MRGRLFKLGEHRLLWGDSSDPENMAALIGDLPVSLVVTDPPYGVNIGSIYGRQRSMENDFLPDANLNRMLKKIVLDIHERYPKTLWYVFAGGPSLRNMLNILHDLDIPVRSKIEWIKEHYVISRGDYHHQSESVIFAGRSDIKHANKARNCSDVVFCKAPSGSRRERHPAEKPWQILEQFILNSSKPGEYVLDPFGGSGSTLFACERTGRKCLMAEIDERWVYEIMRRFLKDFADKHEPVFEITDGQEKYFAVPDEEDAQ